MPTLSLADFADLFGTTPDDFSPAEKAAIEAGNWRHRVLEGAERDALLIDLLKRIEERRFTLVKDEDKSRWERGWGENLADFRNSGGKLDALMPKYIRPGLPLRLRGQFVISEDPNFEANWYALLRAWFVRRHLAAHDNIFEFGCGSGFNVAYIAQQLPKARVTGLDWAQASVDIVEALRTSHGLNVQGRHFDFFHPDLSLDMPKGSAVFTVAALEQTGDKWGAFLEFLVAKKPALCLHVEPIADWYESDKSLIDYTAAKTHEVRNYLRGFAGRLAELEREGRVEILKTRRAWFGSLLIEAYSQVIWRPL